MLLPRIFHLGVLLQQATLIASLRHRDGGQPAPVQAIKEARALRARYHHILTQRNTLRKISTQRGRHLDSFSSQLIEEHLFQPIKPQPDDGQPINSADGTHDSTRNIFSRWHVGIEGSAKPLFYCSPCTRTTQHEQEECARCQGVVLSQQQHIEKEALALFPNAKLVASNHKLFNILFLEMKISPHDDISEIDRALRKITGVVRVTSEEDFRVQEDLAVAYIGGGRPLEQKFCGVGGKGVTMAVLDSGIDYTHARINGPGTVEAYRLAYGTSPESPENKQVNPEVFPTDTVIGGRDFLGEAFVHTTESVESDALPDDNPIDANRHGTMVADAILSVAPQTQLLAYKVCTRDTGTCPGFAVLSALEYSLDPNQDGNMDDRVDIVNLSLGGTYLSSYYDTRTEAMERVFALGVLPVVAAGNEGNIPYIGGPGSKTPNAVSVAATTSWSSGKYSVIASYSSRGPGDDNMLKPDISAPSGLNLAQFGTGDGLTENVIGTSFAAPIVAGALALIKQRCPDCSPFALKAILMNNAKRHVQYTTANQTVDSKSLPSDDAPTSLAGAGEVNVEKALDADFWAYCEEDFQPSLSWGLINAHKDIIFKKKIRVISMSGAEQTLRIRNEFSQKALPEPQENPLTISFSPEVQVLNGCDGSVDFEITLTVDASKAPANRMVSGGKASNDPATIDWNEFGGWVIIESAGNTNTTNTSTTKDISLPYLAIVRQASDARFLGSSTIESYSGGPTEADVKLTNFGAGVAQVDAFELLYTSEDDPENAYGSEISPSDFRYIGYRVVEGEPGICDYLLEFSFTTWEKQQRITNEFFQVHFDVDFDGNVDYVLFNSGVFTPVTDNIACIVRETSTGNIKCTGFPVDHSTNTANIVLRVCSQDIGFATAPTDQARVNVYIMTNTATSLGVTEITDRASEQFHPIEFPKAWVSAPSYDIEPGGTLEKIAIDGTGGEGTFKPLGLMLVTNSNRGSNSTGAATAESETLIVTIGQQTLPIEATPDDLEFPLTDSLAGPECVAWKDFDCPAIRSGGFVTGFGEKSELRNSKSKVYKIHQDEVTGDGDVLTSGVPPAAMENRADEAPKCPEIAVPRSTPVRVPGSVAAITPTSSSTSAPGQNTNTNISITETPFANDTVVPIATVASSTPQPDPPSNSTPHALPLAQNQTISTPAVTPIPIAPLPTLLPPTELLVPASNGTATNATPAPTLRSTSRPTGPVAKAIDMTNRFPPSEASSIFSLGISHFSPFFALSLVASSSLFLLIIS